VKNNYTITRSFVYFSSSDINPYETVVFNYHHVCRTNIKLYCFHDENYLCVCENDHYRANCFGHDTQLDHCDKCLSEGKCLRGDLEDSNVFLCLCPSCYQGLHCEFSVEAFGFTFDSLLVGYPKGVKIIYAILTCLLFIIGFFNNLCSFVTFKRSKPLMVGVGNYLFIVTCLNQIGLFCLLLKVIYITLDISNVLTCKIVSYCLSVFTRSAYWLTSWITVERSLMILFPHSLLITHPRLAIRISGATMLVLLGMHAHEIMYYTIIEHLPDMSSSCVTNFDIHLVSTYNRISTLIHYLVPFCIQVISITLLIVLIARIRTRAIGSKTIFSQVLTKQFQARKELYITPIIIVLSALPQVILTFTLACKRITDWHRHLLLAVYLVSYIPQFLGFIFFVLPSSSYTKEFSETTIAKKYFKWMFRNKKSNIMIISKMKK
jgi:hypothetical protein